MEGLWWLPLIAGVVLLAVTGGFAWRTRRAASCLGRATRLSITALLALIVVALIGASGVWYWYYHRPVPDPIDRRPIFQGITYTRDIRDDPRPLVIHVIEVDLTAPGIEFLVTPPDEDSTRELKGRTVSTFLEEYDVQVAINGMYFEPWRNAPPWDLYPRPGDPVDVVGFAASRGQVYSEHERYRPTVYIGSDNAVSFQDRKEADQPLAEPPPTITNALSGSHLLLNNGVSRADQFSLDLHVGHHPRTALGVDASGERMVIMVIDGRQPNYSEGVSFTELVALMEEYGVVTFVNLDGGGSSTLVIDAGDGEADVLNSPIDQHLPGRQRVVANQLGIFALPLEPASP